MKPVELLAALVDPAAPDEWFVTDGATSVGPIDLELLARGISAGKVPLDAFVRHASWAGWRGLSDLVEHDPSFNPKQTFRVLPATKIEPPRETLPSIDVVDDVEEPPRDPAALFESAADLPEAFLILLATAVQQTQAVAALIHGVRDDAAIVVCSHGARMFELLGDKLPTGDPVFFAAKNGNTLFAEPVPGVGGRAIKARLSRLGTPVEAAFMVPIRVDNRLLALIEVGRMKPFRARDVAGVEALVDTLVETIQKLSWTREWQAPPAPKKS